MPDTDTEVQPTAAPADLPIDLFMDRVVCEVHRHEARARHAELVTGEPYSYNISNTAWITNLPAGLLRRLCRDGRIQAIKLSGWWFIHHDDFHRLLRAVAS